MEEARTTGVRRCESCARTKPIVKFGYTRGRNGAAYRRRTCRECEDAGHSERIMSRLNGRCIFHREGCVDDALPGGVCCEDHQAWADAVWQADHDNFDVWRWQDFMELQGEIMADSRRKGKSGELEVIRELRRIFPEARRNLEQYQQEDGNDILGCPDFVFQVKRHKTHPPWRGAMAEAEKAAEKTKDIPVALTRADREEWYAHLRMDDLLAFIEAWRG